MKLLTILGTRPEIIRLSGVIGELDGLCEHILIHTGQNYDERLSDLFFEELSVRNLPPHPTAPQQVIAVPHFVERGIRFFSVR